MTNELDIQLVTLNQELAQSCARIHEQAFPDFFLTQLGRGFLRHYYATCAKDPHRITVIAIHRESNEVLGFAVGTSSPGKSRLHHLRNSLRAAQALLPALYRRPPVAIDVAHRLFDRSRPDRTVTADAAVLSSIAVAPKSRGTGLSRQLLRKWQDQAHDLGVHRAFLTTDATNNQRARSFYKSSGWKLAEIVRTDYGREMAYYTWGAEPRKVKALQVVGGSSYGGASKIIRDIAEATMDTYDVAVLTSEPRLTRDLKGLGVPVVPFQGINRPIRPIADLKSIIGLTRILKNGNYDIVHAHTFKGGLVSRVAAVLAGTPTVIYTVHNFAYPAKSGSMTRVLNYRLEAVLARATDAITYVSQHLLDEALEHRVSTPNQSHLIPNGIPELRNIPDRVADKSTVDLVYHGRIAPEKGLEEMLAAFDLVAAQHSEVHLWLYGDGPLLPLIQRIASTMLASARVHIMGFHTEVSDILATADIAIQPSHREGLSIALLEAMRAGCCIVASDIPANRTAFGNTLSENLFQCGSESDLAAHLLRRIVNPEVRTAEGITARSRFLECFTSDHMKSCYETLYHEARGAFSNIDNSL